jgi:polar amino acid transport system substrate-binding protein
MIATNKAVFRSSGFALPRSSLAAAVGLSLVLAFGGADILVCRAAAEDSSPAKPNRLLRWGADREGGGPYVYPAPGHPDQVVGFEVDLAAEFGRKLSRTPRLVQSTWDQILPVLARGDIDIALNGYEFTAERARRFRASIPYYVYELGLCVRANDPSIHGWSDLAKSDPNGRRKRIGVLGGTTADRYVTATYGAACDVVRYEGTTETFLLVESGQLDATVQDLPPLVFYLQQLKRYPKLAIVDRPAQPGYYVAYARPDDEELIPDIDATIRQLYADGTLRRIYEKYGIWNAAQERLPVVWSTWPPKETSAEAGVIAQLREQVPLFFRAAGVTVLLALLSMPLAILIGLSIALIRAWPLPVLGGSGTSGTLAGQFARSIATVYVEIIRGTPLAFQLFVVYFVLPDVGVTISAFWAGVLALAVNYSAYEAEIMRLGIQSIPLGQMEAALALGMPRGLAVRRIILPQAIRTVIPATANDFIALFKDTAVCSVIAVEELSKQYSIAAKSTGLFLQMAILASVLYLAMSYPLSLLAAWLERRLARC